MQDTIYKEFLQSVKKFGKNECLAVLNNSRYEIMTYEDLLGHVQNAIQYLKSRIPKGSHASVMLPNGPEWITVDLACAALGVVVVPIHANYKPMYVTYILDHSDSTFFFVHAEFMNEHHDKLHSLKLNKIFVVGDLRVTCSECNIESYDYKKLSSKEDVTSDVRADDLHTIVYTSGTTGEPKGVMLSHANLMSNAYAALKHINIGSTDRFFSFLPLSHAFERTVGYYIPILSGAAIYFGQGKDTLKEDIQLAKPTVFVCVPRIFERVYESVLKKMKGSGVSSKLLYAALGLSRKKRKQSISLIEEFQFKILDAVVLKKIRNVFGSRLRFAVSGGASLSKKIAKFFEATGILIIEGYGLTETSPIVTENRLNAYRFGTVGLPVDGVQVIIDSNKEVLVKGDNVMMGYYKNESATREVIDSENHFHTGDLGILDDQGYLNITGRLKELIVLSTGKNVAPVAIEQALEENKYIAQAMVYGDNSGHLSAFIVIDDEALRSYCNDIRIDYDLKKILVDPGIVNFYMEQISESLREFDDFQIPRAIKLLSKLWSQENDMLTPTLKLKRSKILSTFQ